MAFGSAAEFAIIMKLVDEVSGKLGGIGDKMGSLGQSMTNTGKRMTMGLTMPIIAIGATALKMASDFDASMRNVNAVAQLPEDQFADLKQSVIEFSMTTRASSADVAGALYKVVSAGFEAGEAFEVMKQASKAAGAGLATTEDTANLLISTMRAYGVGVEDAAHINDVFLQTVNQGLTTLPELASSLGRVLPQASAMGVSIEEVGFSMSRLTQSGLSTQLATTSLIAIFREFMTPTKDMQAALDEMGMSQYELIESSGGVLGALRVLKEKGYMDNIESVQKMFNNTRALGGVLSLTRDELAMTTGVVEEFGNSAEGAVDRARTQQYKSLPAQLAKIKSAFEAIAIAIGTTFVPKLVEIADKIVPMLREFGKMDPAMIRIGVVVAGVVAAIGPLLMILGALVSAWGTVATAVAGVGLGAIIGPILLAVGALAGLKLAWDNNIFGIKDFVANIADMLPSMDDLKSAFEVFKETGDIKEALKGLVPPEIAEGIDRIVELVDGLITAFGNAGAASVEVQLLLEDLFGRDIAAKIQPFLVGLEDAIAVFNDFRVKLREAWDVVEKFGESFDGLVTAFQNAGAGSGEFLLILQDIFGWDVAQKIQEWVEIIQGAWDTIKDVFETAWEIIEPALSDFWEGIKAAFSDLEPIIESFKALWAELGPFILALLGLLAGIIVTIVGVIVSIFSGIASAIQPFIETIIGVVQAMVTILTGIIQVVTGFLQLIWGLITGNQEMVSTATEKFKEGIVNIWNGLVKGVVTLVTGLIKTVIAFFSGFITSIIKFFTTLYEKIVGGSIIPDFVNGIINWIATLVTDVVAAISTFVGDIVQWFIDLATDVIEKVSAFVGDVIQWFADMGTDILTGIGTFITDFMGKLGGMFTDAVEWATGWIDIGRDMVAGITAGITEKWTALKNWFNGLIAGLLSGGEEEIEARSPSRKFAELGASIPEGMRIGIESQVPLLKRSMDEMLGGLVKSAHSDLQILASIGQQKGGSPVTTTYNIYPTYSRYSDERTLNRDIRLLELLHA